MIASLVLVGMQALALEPGQALEVVAEIDCQVHAPVIAMNGANSTSSHGSSEKQVALIFVTKWPHDINAEVGVLSIETQGNETTLKELAYSSGYVPDDENSPPVTLVLGDAVRSYFLEPSEGAPGEWSYRETGLLVHGATENFEGKCRLKPLGV